MTSEWLNFLTNRNSQQSSNFDFVTTMVNEETLTLPMRFGWVGLGAMGYPMAGQLCRKLPRTSTLWVYDIDPALTARFLEEEAQSAENGAQGAQVHIGRSSREIAEESVSSNRSAFLSCIDSLPRAGVYYNNRPWRYDGYLNYYTDLTSFLIRYSCSSCLSGWGDRSVIGNWYFWKAFCRLVGAQ